MKQFILASAIAPFCTVVAISQQALADNVFRIHNETGSAIKEIYFKPTGSEAPAPKQKEWPLRNGEYFSFQVDSAVCLIQIRVDDGTNEEVDICANPDLSIEKDGKLRY